MKRPYVPKSFHQKKRSPKPRIIILRIFFLIFLGLVIWHGLGWGIKSISQIFLRVETVYSGVLEDKLAIKVYIAREEEVLATPVTGTLISLVKEGERVPIGATIARFLPVANQSGEIKFKAPFSGQVSYQTDGLEKSLQPSSLRNLGYKEIKRLVSLAKPITANGQVKAGTAVIRIVNNLAPIKLFTSIENLPSGFKTGKRLKLEIPDIGKTYRAQIEHIQKRGNSYDVIMEVATWDDLWLVPREMTLTAIVDYYSGIIVPASAIIEGASGEKGVYILGVSNIEWKPVTVKGQIGEQVAVEGLETATEVILTPHLARWIINK
ncbi:MAG: hypothetical protein PWP31_658 [Clostridia bacterium]|nr:hypothetical protein [Clostridia bacterium]